MPAKEYRKPSYSEKLKDPRWQKLRLQVFERDEWKCQSCGSKDRTLHVHHWYYERGREPWEYPFDCFSTACEECHQREHDERHHNEQLLLAVLRRQRMFVKQICQIMGSIVNAGENLDCMIATGWLVHEPEFPFQSIAKIDGKAGQSREWHARVDAVYKALIALERDQINGTAPQN